MKDNGKRSFRHSLRFRILSMVVAAWLLPTAALSGWLLTAVFPRMERQGTETLRLEAEHAWSAVAENLDRLYTLARDATYDGELTRLYGQRETGAISGVEYVRQGRNYLERKYGREELFAYAALIPPGEEEPMLLTQSGGGVSAEERAEIRRWALEAAADIDTRCALLERGDELWMIRNLMNERISPCGVLLLRVRREELFAPADRMTAAWNGTSEMSVSAEAPEAWGGAETGLQAAEGGRLRYVRHGESRDWTAHWRLTAPDDRVYGEIRRFRLVLSVLFLAMIPAVIWIGIILHRRVTRPLEILADASRRIEGGELGATVPMRGPDELGVLGEAFSNMSLRLRELIDRTYKEEIALRDAQIQALQSRINPHFINNALEDINWQARIDGSDTVCRMVSALSVLLNATMARKERRTVSLREELKVADAYIFFIQERFGDRLTVEREIAEEALEDDLPLLTLQPVLENAVEHGIAPAGGGEILLRAVRGDGTLEITVVNGGKPMDAEDRERIDAALIARPTGIHVGLSNIANRLRLIYHGRAAMAAESDEAGRTVIRMRIPREEEKE